MKRDGWDEEMEVSIYIYIASRDPRTECNT